VPRAGRQIGLNWQPEARLRMAQRAAGGSGNEQAPAIRTSKAAECSHGPFGSCKATSIKCPVPPKREAQAAPGGCCARRRPKGKEEAARAVAVVLLHLRLAALTAGLEKPPQVFSGCDFSRHSLTCHAHRCSLAAGSPRHDAGHCARNEATRANLFMQSHQSS
jgi:hypothetical protein